MWVKVCGLRRRLDVDAANEAGADAVGFVLADSPRRVSPDEARVLAAAVAPGIATFLLTVDAAPAELLDLAVYCGVDGVQPYGRRAEESAAAASRAGLEVLHPVRVRDSVELERIPLTEIPLLDAAVAGLHGGSGTSFDWDLAAGLSRPFVLAGGLGPGNVAEAIHRVAPWGVDASSGLESAPGVKDPALIARFIEEARKA